MTTLEIKRALLNLAIKESTAAKAVWGKPLPKAAADFEIGVSWRLCAPDEALGNEELFRYYRNNYRRFACA